MLITLSLDQKNCPGGRKQLNLTNKSVRYYSQPLLGNRCHVHLLRLYISKLPSVAVEKDLFYCKPLQQVTNEDVWYCAVPMGHNTLDRKLKEIFTAADLNTDCISNHSLRATLISRMYNAKVPEKLIMERSGHLSKEGVRSYERTSTEQIQSICKTLAATVPNNSTVSDAAAAPEQHCDTKEASSKQTCTDALKHLNFEGVSGCTFNINVNYNTCK